MIWETSSLSLSPQVSLLWPFIVPSVAARPFWFSPLPAVHLLYSSSPLPWLPPLLLRFLTSSPLPSLFFFFSSRYDGTYQHTACWYASPYQSYTMLASYEHGFDTQSCNPWFQLQFTFWLKIQKTASGVSCMSFFTPSLETIILIFIPYVIRPLCSYRIFFHSFYF